MTHRACRLVGFLLNLKILFLNGKFLTNCSDISSILQIYSYQFKEKLFGKTKLPTVIGTPILGTPCTAENGCVLVFRRSARPSQRGAQDKQENDHLKSPLQKKVQLLLNVLNKAIPHPPSNIIIIEYYST